MWFDELQTFDLNQSPGDGADGLSRCIKPVPRDPSNSYDFVEILHGNQ